MEPQTIIAEQSIHFTEPQFKERAAEMPVRHRAAMLKAMVLTHGVAINETAREALESGLWKVPRMVRSGMSGGLEFYITHDNEKIAISCPVIYSGPVTHSFVLARAGNRLVLTHPATRQEWEVELLPEPSFYARHTSSGKEMASVVQQCFSKLAVGVFGACSFSARPETACAFCAIRATSGTDAPVKTDEDIIETLEAAYHSEIKDKIETIMLGGGTPAVPDRGAGRFAALAAEIRHRFPAWRVTVMMVPPENDESLLLMKNAGVSELSINLEFESEEAFGVYTPGKSRQIGKKRYQECLLAAARIFESGNVQSLLVVGLEPYEHTLQAVKWLALNGVIPVLSPFRPLADTALATQPAPSPEDLFLLYSEARKISIANGMFLGPKCIPCQCNTMTLPWDSPRYPK